MYFLPKLNPLYEHVAASRINVPDMLDKLGKGGFTGCVNYNAEGVEACCVFATGKMIGAIASEQGTKDKFGLEAIALLFDRIVRDGGSIDVYRMTPDLAMCSHALIQGTCLFSGDEIRQVDMKGILARLKNQEMNGVVRFSTEERHALIFYRNGQPIGFYHDGASELDTSPDESRKIAALPGARLHVRVTRPLEELLLQDLLQMLNLPKLWDAAMARRAAAATRQTEQQQPARPSEHGIGKLSELVDDLREIAAAYLSKQGSTMIDQLLTETGGAAILLDSARTAHFIEKVRQAAHVIDSHAKIDEMVELMKSEIAGRLVA